MKIFYYYNIHQQQCSNIFIFCLICDLWGIIIINNIIKMISTAISWWLMRLHLIPNTHSCIQIKVCVCVCVCDWCVLCAVCVCASQSEPIRTEPTFKCCLYFHRNEHNIYVATFMSYSKKYFSFSQSFFSNSFLFPFGNKMLARYSSANAFW